MRAVLAATVLMGLALAGCSYDTHRPEESGGPTGSGAEDGGPTPSAEPEGDNGVLDVTIESDGAATVEVPFPTMDSCRSPEDWMSGEPSVQGAVPALANATGDRAGRVLVLSTRAERAEWSVQIPLGPACQTLRYDPWTIDPDRDDGGVEVHVTDGSVSLVTVLVRHVRGGSGQAVIYEGPPEAGAWTALREKGTVPV